MPDDVSVLASEREHLALARQDLRRMRERTQGLLDSSGSWGNDELTTRALWASLARRYEQLLDDGVTPLFFGRLDTEDREVFHVGRRHVSGTDGEPVVIDWRAPVAAPYYRASAQDRQGLVRRRRFGFRDGVLTAYEDDHLHPAGPTSALLLQEIERPRSGPMRDIVATVQPEQDALVRAPLEWTVCVQGAPGTGKTAVGLHRAAYLLYAHRARLAQTGVLVVGPNRAFLSYVQEVLPALGEVQVTQATADELAPVVKVRRVAGPAEAQVKGDARMAVVLERALWLHTTRASEPLVLAVGSRRWRLHPEDVRSLERAVRGRHLSWSSSRAALAGGLASALIRLQEDDGIAPPDRAVERLARSSVVKAYVEGLWPALTATRLVTAVLTDRELLRRAADRVLTEQEQEHLGTSAPVRWSRADLALLDEAAHLVERTSGYAHVVVDEAQDLSAMQLRAVGRRCITGSATVLGDLAQATTPGAPQDWSQVLTHLGKPDGRLEVLTTGYRVPREVLEFANRLLPTIAPGIAAASSLRSVPGSLDVRPTDDVVADAAAAVVSRTAAGSVAVVAETPELLARVGEALSEHGVQAELLGEGGPAGRVALVPYDLVKGLEFDSVVLLEPADIAASGPYGLRALYVALTRAVSSLLVLHARELPAELAGWEAAGHGR
ncbi:MAG: ATPase [Frankiales bacterium]|nr:ATPase [Frankiales bacterium]